MTFDPIPALAVLVRHQARFVLIGGLAGRAHGSTNVTNDLDICYARDPDNLERLVAALRELGAELRGAPPGVPLRLDASTLQAGDHFTFRTKAGDLDCLGTPAGVSDFEELDRNAVEIDLDNLKIRVSSIDDLMRMKKAAGRPKDLVELEILGALREETDRERQRHD